MIIGIVATTNKGLIGRADGSLPWHIPSELSLFRKLTTGHSVLMGRKTWEGSVGAKPLPSRRNYILTRGDSIIQQPNVIPVKSIEDFLDNQPLGKTFVIGGAEIYSAMVPFFDELIITFIHDEPETKPGDVHLDPKLLSNSTIEFIETLADTDEYVTERYRVEHNIV